VIQIVRRPLTSDGIVVPMVARSLEWPDLQTLLPAGCPGHGQAACDPPLHATGP
jgi:hypothetical protein